MSTTAPDNAPQQLVPALPADVERLLTTIAKPLLELPARLTDDPDLHAELLEIVEKLANEICEAVMLQLAEKAGIVSPQAEN